MTVPALPDLCWPIDSGCCSGWDDFPDDVKDRAAALATSTLHALSGQRVGGCPVTVRPCRMGCLGPVSPWGPAGMYPALTVRGQWVNVACGCGAQDCSCTTVCEVLLPGPVGEIESVQIGTQTLPETWYRVDNGNRLVWQGPDDTDCWPLCQDMNKPEGEEDTFAVTYLNALSVDGLAAYAAGVLACEFAKACTGGKCRLPAGVTSIVRQGVSMTMVASGFSDGKTGLVEVDAWLRTVNPNALVQPSRVWSPDLPSARVPSWVSP